MIPDTSVPGGGVSAPCATTLTASPAVPGGRQANPGSAAAKSSKREQAACEV